MKRSIKNLIIIAMIILAGVCSYFTMKDVKENSSNGVQGNMPQGGMQQGNQNGSAPENPDSSNEGSSDNTNKGNPPEIPSNSNNGSNNNMEEPPAKPDENRDDNSVNNGNGSMQKPNNDMNSNSTQQQNTPPEMPSDMNQGETSKSMSGIRTIHYIMFGVEGFVGAVLIVYLIMSKFNKLTFAETIGKSGELIIFVIVTIVVTAILTATQIFITQKAFISENATPNNSQMMTPGGMDSVSESVAQAGATGVDGETTTLSSDYTTSNTDESAILVENGGNATIDSATVTKSGGDSSNTENSEFYGVNSGILVTKNSTATIKNATISTNAKGSNAVFSTGEDSKIYISDSTITTTGSSSSRGLDATYGGYIEADNVNITTQGGSCATLATDRGEGTVIDKNSRLETNGTGSPVIYSTGNISIENTEGTANGAQMVVIEGKNSATVTNSTLTASATGNRGDTDQAGIMIYQSMSGDAGEGTGTFSATNSNLSIQTNSKYYKTAPMFFVTNTDAIVNLTNTKLSFGSNILVSCKGTSEWGKSGSNGGNLTLNSTNQTLTGDIEIDNISTLTMNLTSSSSYEGTINENNSAKSISLKLDSSSKITLTGDSYVSSLEDADSSYSNINFNGYKLYVNGNAIN